MRSSKRIYFEKQVQRLLVVDVKGIKDRIKKKKLDRKEHLMVDRRVEINVFNETKA
jgi:hypothetical protein